MHSSLTCKENIYAHFVIFNLTPRKQNKRILSGVRISMLNVTCGFSVVALHSFRRLPYDRSAASKTSYPHSAIHCLFQFTVSNENCSLLCYYAANSGNFVPTFQDNLSVPSSGVKDYCPNRW